MLLPAQVRMPRWLPEHAFPDMRLSPSNLSFLPLTRVLSLDIDPVPVHYLDNLRMPQHPHPRNRTRHTSRYAADTMEFLERRPPRDFSDSQMKPAPLRVARKRRSTANNAGTDAAATPCEDMSQQVPSVAFNSPTPSVRSASPSLAVLVSKYESLDAIASPGSLSVKSPGGHPRPALLGSTVSATLDPPLSDTTNMQNKNARKTGGVLDGHWGTGKDWASPKKSQLQHRVEDLNWDCEPCKQPNRFTRTWGGSVSAVVAERMRVFEQLSGE